MGKRALHRQEKHLVSRLLAERREFYSERAMRAWEKYVHGLKRIEKRKLHLRATFTIRRTLARLDAKAQAPGALGLVTKPIDFVLLQFDSRLEPEHTN